MHSISRHMQQPTIPGLLSTSQGITFDEVRSTVQRARMSTRTRVAALEEEVGGWVVSRGCFGQWGPSCSSCKWHLHALCMPAAISACSPLHPLFHLVPSNAVQLRALRQEAGELQAIVQGYRDAEQRVRGQRWRVWRESQTPACLGM